MKRRVLFCDNDVNQMIDMKRRTMKKEVKTDVLHDQATMNLIRKVLELADKGYNVEVKKGSHGQGYKISTVKKEAVNITAE